jgi:predicted Co/Zn/Cd cation transporter (cation efflux family)
MGYDKRLPALNGALGLIILLLVVQMWLLTATLESYLSGHKETALSGAIISAVLFSACGGLYLFVGRVDRKSRDDRGL